ncbi:MAG: anthranilate phosphoribosyltransferase [Candidatus Omnitrophota bacterium]|jgi:anthranilate phosphoribosyltransferase
MSIANLTQKLQNHEDIGYAGMQIFMQQLMRGELPEQQIKDFLIALSDKGETVKEIVGAAQVMRDCAINIKPEDEIVLDTCGTGGDGSSTLNVSTLVSLTCAALGITVAKHGNRAVSSKSGSADLLEKLGIPIDLSPEDALRTINEEGYAFLYAPNFHPAMKHASAARKSLGRRSIFNCLGPLSNPGGATCQLIGAYSQDLARLMVRALADLGSNRAIVVCSDDGLDEVSLSSPTLICEYRLDSIAEYEVCPEDFGIKPQPLETLQCASIEESLHMANEVLSGALGPRTEIVALNAGFALVAAGVVDQITDGLNLARKALIDGVVQEYVELLRSPQ